MLHYWIPEHVHACATRDGVVFLDVRRNKYIGLDPSASGVLGRVVHNWPVFASHAGDSGHMSIQEIATAADELVKVGLLSEKASRNKCGSRVTLERRRVLLAVGFGTECAYRVQLRHVLAFVAAYLAALWALRFRSLESVVSAVQTRKAKALRCTPSCDIEKATELVSVFRRVRHYFFSGKSRCLLHALTLINFMAYYQLFPTWVIGVNTTPWGAHSWVEQDHYVFDATPERILSYTPIFAV